MKYAVISDIHGNLNALSAILKDAESFRIDKYIFVGDYCAYLPFPNDVINIIRDLNNKIIVQGNEEKYLELYEKQDQSTWTDGQFQALYWCYKHINKENLKFLFSLPKIAGFEDQGTHITVTHSSIDIFGDIEYREFSSLKMAEKYQSAHIITNEVLLSDMHEYLNNNENKAVIDLMPDGIYIFGHNHSQWYAHVGKKTFINPGSCGLPLDGMSGAPYTLLEITGNKINVTQRRVQYDVDNLICTFRNSSLFKAAPIWCNIIMLELENRFEHALPFLHFVNQYANDINDSVRPYTVKTWTEAYELWCLK